MAKKTEQTAPKKKWKFDSSMMQKATFLLMGISMFTLISFVENHHEHKMVKRTLVRIDYDFDNYFVDEKDILKTLTLNDADQIVGKKYRDIDLKMLELRLESIKFVEDAQLSTDHKGTLMVEIKQSKPIARIISQNSPHAYIGSNATTLSTSEKFTARVLLVDGPFVNRLFKENYLRTDSVGSNYFKLIEYIDQNEYWKKMITQITIQQNGEVIMQPQIGDYIIYFGKPEDIEFKFRKIDIFYKEILPSKGWDAYKSVNVKFKDQIVCE